MVLVLFLGEFMIRDIDLMVIWLDDWEPILF